MKTIAIQGIKGSYHHQVACEYFGDDQLWEECLTFDSLAKSLQSGKSDYAVMALENSIAGSIIPNYALIDDYNLQIVGEHYLNIHHQLMALPGSTISDIKEVASHPMALLQCKDFFDKYPQIRLLEDKDTAEVAQKISAQKLTGIAAIASQSAAKLYGLEILAKNIQSIENNATRFVILKAQSDDDIKGINKASFKFVLEHKRGSLAAILNVLSDCSINLTKIQSLPIIKTPWKYAFFVDVTFEDVLHYEKAKSILEIMTESFKIHGAYKNEKQ